MNPHGAIKQAVQYLFVDYRCVKMIKRKTWPQVTCDSWGKESSCKERT